MSCCQPLHHHLGCTVSRRRLEFIEDVDVAHAGQIVALFDVDIAPGDTLTDGSVRWAMTSVNAFQRNDPT
ncbi:elongation factor G, putative [Medicago truncatula]|uniref:Elongation factor G, putative n=1 Tax=Medicago truncatula TaxID=3880 RepID=A0A072U4V8_MEDTR|nr:elongation factor G, putative [Medicago truncatula]